MTVTTFLRPLRIAPDELKPEPLDLDPKAFQSPLPMQNHHLVFEDDAIGMAVGIWDSTTMQEAFGPYPGDEFITVLDGSFSILDAAGEAVTGHAGQSATFRNAVPVSWKQDGYLRKIYLTLQVPADQTPEIGSAAGGVKVLDGQPLTDDLGSRRVIFRNDAGTMSVEHHIHHGLFLPAAPATMHELCRVLIGEIILTDEQAHIHRFGPDDHVFIPKAAVVARKFAEGTEAYHVLVKA